MKELLCSNRDKMHKVLVVLPGSIDFRGIQIFFLNVLTHYDYRDLEVDLYFGGKQNSDELLKILSLLQVGIYVGELNIYSKNERIRYKRDLQTLMCSKNYESIHVNSGKPWFNLMAIQIAKNYGVKKRIVHSHSAHFNSKNVLKRAYKEYMCYQINQLSTDCLACSKEAGIWMFGDKHFSMYGEVINNGIDVEKYTFSIEKRKQLREKYSMRDNHIILHVGAFNIAKNHKFLINMFRVIKQTDAYAKLFLIGTGEFQEEIERQVVDLNLEDDVIFVGATNQVADYMQMADLFVLPSVFEGLGIVNIEAQASGLRCMASDVVPEHAKVTELLEFLPLDEGYEYWAKKALEKLTEYERKDTSVYIRESGFDSRETAKLLQELYCR